MPHVVVKLWPGKSEAQKQALSDAIVRDVTGILHYGDESVSVCFEEVAAADWQAQVYGPDIEDRWDTLTKRPGYGPRAAR
jgi:4-oxalocrotonate tautomerase